MKKLLICRCYLIRIFEKKLDFHKENSFYLECEKHDKVLFAICKKHHNVEEKHTKRSFGYSFIVSLLAKGTLPTI